MSALAIEGLDGLLLPPEPGLAYLRHDRAGELRVAPGSITCADGAIAALTTSAGADVTLDGRGCTLVPGLVDCHTHLPFAGWRAEEYGLRVAGVAYPEIARRGGGIRASSRALAERPDDAVLAQAAGVAAEMLQHGTTTLECKSGYGLSIAAERRQLVLATRLGAQIAQTTTVTALLAHALPDGFERSTWLDGVDGALDEIVADVPVTAVDCFIEEMAFGLDDLRRVAGWARRLGVDLRAHAAQLSALRSVPVAVEEGARSVDHLATLDPADIPQLAASECAAVLLPGAEVMNDEHPAPGRALADQGAICVLATDCNPGTSPILSLPLIAGMAVRRYGWSVEEAFLALTLNAAWVLRLHGDRGTIEPGKRADLVLLDGPLAHVPYRYGRNPVLAVVVAGELAWLRPGEERRLRVG